MDAPTGSRRRLLGVVAGAVGVGVTGCLGGSSTAGSTDDGGDADVNADTTGTGETDTPPIHAGYDTRDVVVETAAGDRLGAVTAAVADTRALRYTGLSDTASLPEDRGMLFVHEREQGLTYVMREMDFGIDIVFADADRVITEIHHAPAPGPDEDGDSQRYPGRGKYVLEVGYDWTTARDVAAGDVLRFDPV
jgi:uncharacterized membrane protein (UPF0127 family)